VRGRRRRVAAVEAAKIRAEVWRLRRQGERLDEVDGEIVRVMA